jgi:outer membrane protein OmpA-like peptidoglycan-associated protein
MAQDKTQGTTRAKRQVVIFGAGITGLTAAHELIERGFEVEVYEPEPPSLYDYSEKCAVGGMARTQWARVDRPPWPGADEGVPPPPPGILSTQPLPADVERFLDPELEGGLHRITFEVDSDELDERAKGQLAALAAQLKDHPELKKIEIRGYTYELGTGPVFSEAADRIDVRRARAVKEHLESILKKEPQQQLPQLTVAGLGLAYRDDWTRTDKDRCYVDFHTVEDWIPGEHGFRFFPTFYRNLRDTMGRTPISSDEKVFNESGRTVLDNLVETTLQGIRLEPPRPSYILPREPITSKQKAFELLRDTLAASGFHFSDQALLGVKLFKYWTSCKQRRQQYESMSWWDFVEGDRYSAAFQKYLDQTPQALVAMTAKECDARTQGSITTQIFLDQFTKGRLTDATLNGPTSGAWFVHWRHYLRSQGVIFYRGELKGFEILDDKTLWAKVDFYDKDQNTRRELLVRDYYVVALPIEAIRKLVDQEKGLHGEDFTAIRKMDLGEVTEAKPQGALQHLSGIQYYFRSELKLLPGHVIYADSDWGLSSIFQTQFWKTRRGWWDGYRGLLTVGIGNWYKPSRRTGKSAWETSRDEIAVEVWEQIKDSLSGIDPTTVPEPILYHLDDNILFKPQGPPCGNKTRILINHPGTFQDRPGKLARPSHSPDEPLYQVHYGRLVLAGTYMKTYFRLTTMEAANESARHAVNAILREDSEKDGGFRGDRCSIADPEDHEFDDLKFFIELDEQLFKENLPHFVDILDLSELPNAWLSRNPDLSAFGLPAGIA